MSLTLGMRALLLVLTNQSTIIFIFFADVPSQGGQNSHVRGKGTKVGVALSPQSGVDPEYFMAVIRFAFI